MSDDEVKYQILQEATVVDLPPLTEDLSQPNMNQRLEGTLSLEFHAFKCLAVDRKEVIKILMTSTGQLNTDALDPFADWILGSYNIKVKPCLDGNLVNNASNAPHQKILICAPQTTNSEHSVTSSASTAFTTSVTEGGEIGFQMGEPTAVASGSWTEATTKEFTYSVTTPLTDWSVEQTTHPVDLSASWKWYQQYPFSCRLSPLAAYQLVIDNYDSPEYILQDIPALSLQTIDFQPAASSQLAV